MKMMISPQATNIKLLPYQLQKMPIAECERGTAKKEKFMAVL
jgi:hypothetical protein